VSVREWWWGVKGRPIALSSLVVLACTSTTPATSSNDPRLDELEAAIAREEARLDQVQRDVLASEQRAAEARSLAETEACLAKNAEIRSSVAMSQAQCLEEVSAYNGCEAAASEARADSTLLGCLFGIGLATVTGGAAAPIALGGCALGGAVSPGGTCTKPGCADDFDQLERRALARLKLAELPMCGGYLGLAVKDSTVSRRAGLKVRKVQSSTTASGLGLGQGDVLLSIDGRGVARAEDVDLLLGRTRPGAKIRITFVRRRMLLSADGMVREPPDRKGPRLQFGAEFSAERPNVTYANAVEVVRVEEPASGAGLQVGEVLNGVNGTLVRSRDDLRRLLSGIPAGTSVTLQRAGKGPAGALKVELEPRRGRKGI
jgi:hypothetical protein